MGLSPLPAAELLVLARTARARRELASAFTRYEKSIIDTPLGKLPQYKTFEGTLRSQPLDVLGWALGGAPWTYQWGQPAGFAYRRLRPQRLLTGDLPAFLASPKLRPRRELAERQKFEHSWAWRVRVAMLPLTIALAGDEEHADEDLQKESDELLARAVARRAEFGRTRGWFTPIAHDFPLGRKVFGRVFDACPSPMYFEYLANEGLRAANWLGDVDQPWRQTSTATPLGFVVPARLLDDRRFLEGYLNPRNDSRWYY